MCSTVTLNPFSIVGSRIEITGFNEYKGMIDGLIKVYKYEGLKGYMRGVIPTCIKDGPFAAFFLPFYRTI